MNEKVPEKRHGKSPERITRRVFGRNALAASVAAFYTSGSRAAEVMRTYKDFLAMLKDVRTTTRSQASLHALTNGKPSEAAKVLIDSQIAVERDALEGTPHDLTPLEKHTVFLGKQRGKLRVMTMQSPEDIALIADANQGYTRYGNAIPIGDNLVISNVHVLNPVLSGSLDTISREHGTLDLGVALLPNHHFTEDQIVSPTMTLKDSDVHGQFVAITSIDPDSFSNAAGASVAGRKTLGGIAVKVTEALMKYIITPASESERQMYLSSFAMLVPFESVNETKDEAAGGIVKPMQGMSGSPVFAHVGGKYVFCGVIHSVNACIYHGRKYGIVYFHGPDAIATAVNSFQTAPFATKK